MFKRSFRSQDQKRVDKAARQKKPASTAAANYKQLPGNKLSRLQRSLTEHECLLPAPRAPPLPSPVVSLAVGREGRLFAAHQDVLCRSPFFADACRAGLFADGAGRAAISLPGEDPEVLSAVLEFLYRGDYYPRLLHGNSSSSSNNNCNSSSSRRHSSWSLESSHTHRRQTPQASSSPSSERMRDSHANDDENDAVVYLASIQEAVLRDTAIYCAADRYGLDGLKLLALRKQGLQAGIDVATILRSAHYAYAHTPDSDSRLRAHYLALIIRCRKTFKRSGTMQAEMEAGGSKLFFDLFVAMCNHLDDVIDNSHARSPRTV